VGGTAWRRCFFFAEGIGLIRCAAEDQRRLFGLSRRDKKVKGVSPTLRLQGEFLLPDDAKETKKSGAHDLAGLRPDTALLRPERLAMLKLASLALHSDRHVQKASVLASTARRVSRARKAGGRAFASLGPV